VRMVSSASFSTACRDKTSEAILLKLSGAFLQDLWTFQARVPMAIKSPTPKPKGGDIQGDLPRDENRVYKREFLRSG
jgi:hypothetical protein